MFFSKRKRKGGGGGNKDRKTTQQQKTWHLEMIWKQNKNLNFKYARSKCTVRNSF